jgi:hypothetical protein
MKLSNLHTKTPLELTLGTNLSLKHVKTRKQYLWKDNGLNYQAPPPGASHAGGHTDAYIEAKPRLKKYFGGSFLSAI